MHKRIFQRNLELCNICKSAFNIHSNSALNTTEMLKDAKEYKIVYS